MRRRRRKLGQMRKSRKPHETKRKLGLIIYADRWWRYVVWRRWAISTHISKVACSKGFELQNSSKHFSSQPPAHCDGRRPGSVFSWPLASLCFLHYSSACCCWCWLKISWLSVAATHELGGNLRNFLCAPPPLTAPPVAAFKSWFANASSFFHCPSLFPLLCK